MAILLPSDTRVLMLSTDVSALIPGSATHQRLASYAQRLAQLTVLVVGANGVRSREGKLVVRPVPGIRLLRPWAIARAIRMKLSIREFDVISAQDPFETGLGALWGSRTRYVNIPLHVQVHTDFLSWWYTRESLKNRIRVFIADRVLPHARGIRVVSERVSASLEARYGSRIPEPSVIPVSVPLPSGEKTSLPGLKDGQFAFIAVGRLEREKHIEDILEALARVRTAHPEAALFVVGDGRLKQPLINRARQLGVEDAVTWLGARTDAVALMASSHAFVQASTYEGYGRTLVEAALARLPIVTTDVGIVGSVLTDGKDALVVPVCDVPALAAAMNRVLEDASLRASLGSEAAHTARNHLMANMAQPDEIAEDLARAASAAKSRTAV